MVWEEGVGLVLCGPVALEVLLPFAKKCGVSSGRDTASLHRVPAALILAVTACEAAALSLPGLERGAERPAATGL